MEAQEHDVTIADREAIYRVLTDAYIEKFSIRAWLLNKMLFHMLDKIKEEPTIYFLMERVKGHKSMKNRVYFNFTNKNITKSVKYKI